jgi:hypothetical protein
VLSLPSTEREKTLNIIAKMRQLYLYYVIDLCAFYELHSTLQECQKKFSSRDLWKTLSYKKTDLEAEVMMV